MLLLVTLRHILGIMHVISEFCHEVDENYTLLG